jgi:hypothetical protein
MLTVQNSYFVIVLFTMTTSDEHLGCNLFSLQKLKGQRQRFSFISHEMKENRLPSYWSTLVALINCVIVGQKTLRDRVRTRKEFLCRFALVQ